MFHGSSVCDATSFVSFAFTVCWRTLNRSLFRSYSIWHCLLSRDWFVQYQQQLYIGVILQYNSGSMAATLNKSPFQYLYFTWVLCVNTFISLGYIILDKGCHILYVFGLNSTVCSHTVGEYLSSNQVTCYFMIFLKGLHKTFWGTAKKCEKKLT